MDRVYCLESTKLEELLNELGISNYIPGDVMKELIMLHRYIYVTVYNDNNPKWVWSPLLSYDSYGNMYDSFDDCVEEEKFVGYYNISNEDWININSIRDNIKRSKKRWE